MKLSEAIRLEGMTLEQSVGVSHDVTKSACALQGAVLMVGRDAVESEYCTSICAEWPWAARGGVVWYLLCPECTDVRSDAADTIVHLNDHHRWTRNQIADWVETVEPAEEAVPEPERQQTRINQCLSK